MVAGRVLQGLFEKSGEKTVCLIPALGLMTDLTLVGEEARAR